MISEGAEAEPGEEERVGVPASAIVDVKEDEDRHEDNELEGVLDVTIIDPNHEHPIDPKDSLSSVVFIRPKRPDSKRSEYRVGVEESSNISDLNESSEKIEIAGRTMKEMEGSEVNVEDIV